MAGTGNSALKRQFKNSLSLKLLRIVLLSAVVVGGVLSCAQIVFDADKVRQAVTADAERILDMFRDPSTQALYSLDRDMAMQVIEGLFQDPAVRKAAIGHPNEAPLADASGRRRRRMICKFHADHADILLPTPSRRLVRAPSRPGRGPGQG